MATLAEAPLVRPDRAFVEEIIAAGGGDLKRCMQCANCSVVCGLSEGKAPFPRKEVVWAQWGLKDRLMADPDVWLCHQCNDCSLRCPRGARPGDVLAAIRRKMVEHYALPRFLARWVNDAKLLPAAFLIPVVLLAAAVLARDPLEEALGLESHPAFYAAFFPHWLLIGFYSFFTGLALIAAVVGVARFWKAMGAADARSGTYKPSKGVVLSLLQVLKEVATHGRFAHCEAQAPRRVAHLTAFYGFAALFVVTVWATLDLYVLPPVFGVESLYPFGLLHPMKILANVGGLLLVFGALKAMADRRKEGRGSPVSTSFDRIFVWVLLGVGVTGFAVEVLRFTVEPTTSTSLRTLAYGIYFVHLALVFHLLVYLPYSKFAHVLYRTVAMVYAEHTGRYRPIGPPRARLETTLTRLQPATARTASVAPSTNGNPRLAEPVGAGEPVIAHEA